MQKFLVLAGAVLLSTISALAQETRGAITGRVYDPASASVAGAKVMVTNTDTNVVTALSSNEAGHYEAPLLVPGNYQVSAEIAGFKKAVREGIALSAGSRLEVDFKLELGGVSDAVTVSGEAPLIDADTLSSGKVVETKDLMNLPWPGDNTMVLAALTAGVQTSNTISDYSVRLHSGAPGTGISISGGVGGNEYAIDGTSNNAGGRAAGFNPAPELIQAVRMETSAFDASSGRGTGIAISVMTRAGTNQYHGSVRESHQQAAWRAVDFFTKQTYYNRIAAAKAAGNQALADQIRSGPALTPGRVNEFAGTFGGAVVIPKLFNGKNKLFFFGGYAGFRVGEYRQSYNAFPTSDMRNGDFSRLLNINATNYQIYDPYSTQPDPSRSGHVFRTPFPGNIVPASRITNPMYKFFNSYLPLPNTLPGDPKLQPNQDFTAYSTIYTERYDSYVNRYDYNMNSTNRFFARWSWSEWKNSNPTWHYYSPLRLWEGCGQYRHNVGIGADWVHNFGTRTLLDVAIGANANRQQNVDPGFEHTAPSSIGLPSYMDMKASSAPVLPNVSWSGWTGFSPPMSLGTNRYRVLTGKADLSHQRTRHTLKTGIDVRGQFSTAFTPGNNAGNFSFTSAYTQRTDDGYQSAGTGNYGGSWAAFMMGLPTSASTDVNASSAFANPYLGFYVQDNWRVNNRLSLNFGLRVEYEWGPTERYNRMIGQFDPAVVLPITDAARAAYAKIALPEVPLSSFPVLGGALFPGTSASKDRRLWDGALSLGPRFAAAYQLTPKTVLRFGAGMFFDTLNVLAESFNQLGFSWNTSTAFTNDFGQNWLVGNPAAGVSPLTDPFPVRADGTRFDTPPGSKLGPMASVGRSYTYVPFDRPHPRLYRWRMDVQRQIGNAMVLNFGYSGTYADRIGISQALNAVPAQYWSFDKTRNNTVANNWNTNLANPFNISNFASLKTSDPALYQYMASNSFFTATTIRKSVLLAPFPQMNGITATVPSRKSKQEQFDFTLNRRFSRGFNVNVAYTRLIAYAADYIPNSFDTLPAWEPTNNGRPHRLISSAVMELPFGRSRRWLKRGIGNWLAGGYQVTFVQEYQPGALVSFNSTSYYSGNLDDVCSTGPHTLAQWFNTSNFVTDPTQTATTGQARTFPTYISGYGGCRGDSMKRVNGSIQRDLRLREGMTLQLRGDFYNLANHSQFNTPNTSPTGANFGQVTSVVNGGGSQPSTNRAVKIQARITF